MTAPTLGISSNRNDKMTDLKITIGTHAPTWISEEFRFLWLRQVEGFRPGRHCARCLKGRYIIGGDARGMLCDSHNGSWELQAERGETLYLCGVNARNDYDRNLHVAMRVRAGSSIRIDSGAGFVVIHGAERLHFDDAAARRRFPQRDESFLTCRNFQFGAQYYGLPGLL